MPRTQDKQNNEKQEAAPDLFDRFIDQFSARELKTRVWAVVLLGFALISIAGFAGWWLLTHEFFVADEPGLQAVRLIRLLFKGL